jgi:DNA-directed RNA polymerase subunit N (RpoN/RPB10)
MNMIKRKHYLFKEYKNGRVGFGIYNNYKLELSRILKRSKNDYFRRRFNQFGNDIKNTWKTLNKLLGLNKHKERDTVISDGIRDVTCGTKICNMFNNYFVSVGEGLNANIPVPQKYPLDYLGPQSVPGPSLFQRLMKCIKC